jgi:uncharacterized protein (DUF924 family)
MSATHPFLPLITDNADPEAVLAFWFDRDTAAKWWSADAAFDRDIRTRFAGLIRQAFDGELHTWRDNPKGRLAEIIVLDQFSRNAFRNSAAAFAQDAVALVLAQEAVRLGVHASLSQEEATFLLMPFMHSESKKIHQHAEALFREFAPQTNYDFELRHKAIIDRFGRYPHRNAILDRTSTEEELAFLRQPGSRF